MMFLENAYVDDEIKSLGFKNFLSYRRSELWRIIQNNIQERDMCYCRARRCNKRSLIVHPITFNRYCLSGQTPYAMVILCKSCQQKTFFDGGTKLDLAMMAKRTMEILTGTKIVKGISNPAVGIWFKNQKQANQQVLLKLTKELETLKNGISV
jgi:hypothetical protein